MATRKNEANWIESRERWQINVQSDGERRTFSSSIAGKKGKIAAEKKADAWLEKKLVNNSTKAFRILDDWGEALKTRTSWSHYRQQRNYIDNWIKPVIGHKKIESVTKRDLQEIIDRAYKLGNNGNGMAEKTLKNIRSCISSFFKYCRSIPCTTLFPEGLTIPRGAKPSEKTIATKDDLRVLFSTSTSEWRGKPIEDPFIHAYRFMVVTGLRPGELVGLERTNIRNGRMTITHSINQYEERTNGKNANSRRTQQLSETALQILADQYTMLMRLGMVSKYVFPDKDGDYITQQNFRRAWKRYCAANRISGANTPYEMRHTFVSVVDEMPTQLKKMVVGHSKSMDTEGIYGHQKAGDMERAAAYIDAAFRNILSTEN